MAFIFELSRDKLSISIFQPKKEFSRVKQLSIHIVVTGSSYLSCFVIIFALELILSKLVRRMVGHDTLGCMSIN